MWKGKTAAVLLCTALLLAACGGGSLPRGEPRVEEVLRVQGPSAQAAADPEPPAPGGALARAIYGFDWKDMAVVEAELGGVAFFGSQYYVVAFADLDLDGAPEILIYNAGERMDDGIPARTMIFAVEDGALVHRGTTVLGIGRNTYGPDSWRDGFKAYYEKEDGERFLVEYIVDGANNGRVSAEFLYEVSLDGYAATPVRFCWTQQWVGQLYYRFDGGDRAFAPGDFAARADSFAEMGFVEVGAAEYEQLGQAYTAGLTPAGYIRYEEALAFSTGLGEDAARYGIRPYQTRGFDIALPEVAGEQRIGEIIQRTIADNVYERYLAFARELETPAEPAQREPWRAPVYDDPARAAFSAFPWMRVEDTPLARGGGYGVWFADLNLDGETEVVLDVGDGWAVYALRGDALVFAGDLLLPLSQRQPIGTYYRNALGDAVVPLEFASQSYVELPGQEDLPGKRLAVRSRYYAELSLRDLTVNVYQVSFEEGGSGPPSTYYVSTNPRGVPLLTAPDDAENLLGYDDMERRGFAAVSGEAFAQALERREDGYSEPLELEGADDVVTYTSAVPRFYGWRYRYFNGQYVSFPEDIDDVFGGAPLDEIEAYLNDMFGQLIYAEWLAYTENGLTGG